MTKTTRTEEWTVRLVLIAIGAYILLYEPAITKLILGVPFTFGPLIESPEFRVVFKIVVNRVSGRQVFQVEQRNISNSNVIGTARDVHIYHAPKAADPVDEEWDVDEEFYLGPTDHRDFPLKLEEGSRLVGNVEADNDVSCYILGKNALNSFINDENFSSYWDKTEVTRTKVSFIANRPRTFYFVIHNESDDEEDEVSVSLKLRVERGS